MDAGVERSSVGQHTPGPCMSASMLDRQGLRARRPLSQVDRHQDNRNHCQQPSNFAPPSHGQSMNDSRGSDQTCQNGVVTWWSLGGGCRLHLRSAAHVLFSCVYQSTQLPSRVNIGRENARRTWQCLRQWIRLRVAPRDGETTKNHAMLDAFDARNVLRNQFPQ
jgi:hypothetical protein